MILRSIVLAGACIVAPLAKSETFLIAADAWCPHTCSTPERPGYLIDIARAIFEKAGHTVKYKESNWARAIIDARKGDWVAIAGAVRAEAPDFAFPEHEQGSAKNCFYTSVKSTWTYAGIPSLAGKMVGAVVDYSYTEELDAYFKKNQGKTVQLASGSDALDTNAQKVIAGRIDTFIEDSSVVTNYVHDKKIQLRKTSCLEDRPLYVAISPARKDAAMLATLLSDGTDQLRKSGELSRILGRYGLEDWQAK